MAARQPQNLTLTHFGTEWLRFQWEDNSAGAGDAPEGFNVFWGDTSLTVPTWTVPPAVDVGLNGGNDETPVETYTFMVHTPTSVACYWETFEEYNTGVNVSMNKGGSIWDGAWSNVESTLGYKGYGDNFESYPVGVQTMPMNGGTGWNGPWKQ